MLSSSTNVVLFIVHVGCQSCFKGQSPLKNPLDLQTEGSIKTTCISSGNCSLQGEFFDYNDFQPRWKKMSDSDIFSFQKVNNEFSLDVSVCQTFYLD